MRRPTALFTVTLLGLLVAPTPRELGQASVAAVRPNPVITDFNGDGFSDLAVGVISEGDAWGGAVNILYGSGAGLQAVVPDDQFWNQNSVGVKDQAELVDLFGSSLAAGDFNGDGFTDLAIGVESEEPDQAPEEQESAGAVAVLYGTAEGLQADAPDDQFWTQNSPGVKDQVDARDRWGSTLASGDFNADGFADLAVGAHGEDVTIDDQGAVNVLYGSARGLQADAPDDQFWTQDSPGVEDEAELNDALGLSATTSDFNADGFQDLAIGVVEDIDGAENAGAVNVLYGSAEGLQADAPDDQFWSQDSPGMKDRSEQDDEFGDALVAGDFNGDEFPDLAVAGPKEGVGARFQQGAVSVLFGSAGGLQADAPDDQFWSQDSPDVKGQAEGGDLFGWALAAGDFNADGLSDLTVGVLGENQTRTDAGAVNVLYGSPAGLQARDPDDQIWSQALPGVRGDAEAEENFGAAARAEDYNADGFADLAIGVERDTVGGIIAAGSVNVLYGTANGLQADDPDDQLWNQASPSVKENAEGDFFGAALT
jgi:predicted NUDIX family NTP pyrophosphohydrolase